MVAATITWYRIVVAAYMGRVPGRPYCFRP